MTTPANDHTRPTADDLDTAALALIAYDIALLDDADLDRPTPCSGWTVTDLLHHMNQRHDAISDPLLGAQHAARADPRQQFAVSAARWTQALAIGTAPIRIPGLAEPTPSEQVRAVHFVDMLTHRWDLATALGRACRVDDALTDAAIPIAERVTSPGSPLLGTAYQPRRHGIGAASAMERLVALLGRDPAWSPLAR